MQPLELVELLNDIFSQFEIIAEKYGIEKIKTIGDCFMAASGVPRSRPDHASALVRMAIEMRELVERRAFTGGRNVRIRIGINSGPIVAGVIGKKKFIYDLWGDTVNVASRMESHGKSGLIQVTAATHELIKDDFACSAAGVIDVKGKGPTEVWYVR
jgi:adenylate cyclase